MNLHDSGTPEGFAWRWIAMCLLGIAMVIAALTFAGCTADPGGVAPVGHVEIRITEQVCPPETTGVQFTAMGTDYPVTTLSGDCLTFAELGHVVVGCPKDAILYDCHWSGGHADCTVTASGVACEYFGHTLP
jgi:hypothetical protein